MHWWVRSPSPGPNNVNVYKPRQNLQTERGLYARKTSLSPPPSQSPKSFITERSKVVRMLWFISIVNVRPLYVTLSFTCSWSYCLGLSGGHLLGKSYPLGLPLVLFLFYAISIVFVPFPYGVWCRIWIQLCRFRIIAFSYFRMVLSMAPNKCKSVPRAKLVPSQTSAAVSHHVIRQDLNDYATAQCLCTVWLYWKQ